MEAFKDLPPWAILVLVTLFVSVFGAFMKLVYRQYTQVEHRVNLLEAKTDMHITEEKHERDLERIAESHERSLERIVLKHEKELASVNNRMDESFRQVQSQIAESNKTVHGRLDDLHAVLLTFVARFKGE